MLTNVALGMLNGYPFSRSSGQGVIVDDPHRSLLIEKERARSAVAFRAAEQRTRSHEGARYSQSTMRQRGNRRQSLQKPLIERDRGERQ